MLLFTRFECVISLPDVGGVAVSTWYLVHASICCIDGIGSFGWHSIDALVDLYLQTKLTFTSLHRRQIFSVIPGTYES